MLFILNPKAGQMRANRYLTQILSVFIRGGYDVTVHISGSDCFRNAVVFTPHNRNGFCIEPQTNATNFINMHGEGLIDESGLMVLPAGKRFRHLLEEDQGDIDARQMRIAAFVDECNKLMEKHFPGKWKYAQDIRSAICYLAMIKPSENYLFKSTPAHHFAEYMEYPNDIGAGQTFKLKHYYDMCDRLIELAGECPELLAADAGRPSTWKDPSRHVLAYDLIYCMDAYELTSGMIHPPVKSKSGSAKQRAYRAEMATMVQKEIDGLQDQVDELNHQIDELSPASFEGKSIRTKAFGMVRCVVANSVYHTYDQFAIPICRWKGFERDFVPFII